MAKDKWDELLEKADKGQTAGTYGKMRQEMPTMPKPMPKGGMFGIFEMGDKQDMPKPKSKAPAGMANEVKGDIGMYRQMEAGRMSRRKLGGGTIANPLRYRKPETAIDGKYGPGDKVC